MRRRWRSLVALVLSTALAPACASEGGGAGGSAGSGGAGGSGGAAGWPACDPAATLQTVTFVHMNDMHGHYERDALTGTTKVSRIRGVYERVKAENPYTLFTNGGDDYEKGSVVEALSNYASTREVMRALRFDVRVIGNHDMAWSREELLAYASDDHGLVLGSNLEWLGDDASAFGAVNYGALRVGCVTLGFVGAVSAPWDEENRQYQGDYYPEVRTRLDFVDVHRELIGAHRGEVDLLVAVSHLGLGDDVLVAREAPGLDVVLGGHSHTPMFVPEVVGKTLVVQAGSYSSYVARLDLDVDLVRREVVGHRYTLELVTPALEAAVETETEVAQILDRYGPDATKPFARLENAQPKLGACRLAAEGALQVLGVDAAAVGTRGAFGGVRGGAVSQQDLFDAFPLERQPAGTPSWNGLYVVTVLGADLARLGELPGNEWALSLPASIDPAATYRLALPKYAAYHPAKYLPAGVTVGEPVFGAEAWTLLEGLARARAAECRYVDTGAALPSCP